MSDLFGIAKSGIKAYKESLATTGQNIANVGNENYARREANLTEVRSSSADVLAVNSNSSYGVKVDGITRAFDQFIEMQLQTASADLSFATSQTLILERLEKVLLPNEMTVSKKLQDFFASLSTVSEDPSNLAARHIAVDAGHAVALSIKTVAKGINDLRELAKDNVVDNVRQFNETIETLSSIQREILGNTSPKTTPNNLLDQRDELLSNLTKVADIAVDYKVNGSVKVTVGTVGQGRTLIDGLEKNYLEIQMVDDAPKVFLTNGDNQTLSTIQVQSGEIAGNLAADITLTSAKAELDRLSRKLTTEFNEFHKFGVDLNGNRGTDFFSLDSVKIKKTSIENSSSQLRVEGFSETWLGKLLNVNYNSEKKLFSISDTNGVKIHEFSDSIAFDGLRFNLEGVPKLGDSFTVLVSNNSSENLNVNFEDGRLLAAGSFYSVERSGSNNSDSTISVTSFSEIRDDNLENLNNLFENPRNTANSVNFVNNGVLGHLDNVNNISELSSLKSQAKIQYTTPLSNLDASSKLKITIGGTEHVFSIGTLVDQVTSYAELAQFFNTGGLKSDTNLLSFSDLGLHAGGNTQSLTVSSAGQPPYSTYGKLTAGSLNTIAGILIPADEGTSDLKIFTREGIQLTGVPLSEKEANELILKANGFTDEAKYTAKYLSIGSESEYIGGKVDRLTTSGSHSTSITGIGFSNNLNSYASNSFPSSRSGMSSAITVQTAADRSAVFTTEAGMMAGQIAEKFNKDVGNLGVAAFASNRLEILDIANGRIQFDLFGKNAIASSIDVTIANLDTTQLVAQINSSFDETGINAAVSGNGSLLLFRSDGNDIALKNLNLVADISMRQLDKFGEPIQTAPTTVSSGKHIVSGGQIELISPAAFDLTFNGVNRASSLSTFNDGFIKKTNDIDNNITSFSFYTSALTDGASVDENSSIPMAASASYGLTISSDNATSNISANFKPRKLNEFTSGNISKKIVSELRSAAPKAKFVGNDFTLSDGFPPNGATFDFQLGEQKYTATLNISSDYTISGSNVIIGSETLSFADGLERIIAASRFSVAGPEKERIVVGFEKNGSSFRLFAAAKDGVLSGHCLAAASSNSVAQKNNFHVSNLSTAELLSDEIDLTQADKSDFAKLVVGSTVHSLSFATASDTISSSPALPTGITTSLVSTGTNKAKLKISIKESVLEKNIRLVATNNSANFGVVTASSQITVRENDFIMSNYNNSRVVTTGSVSSLADEVISISGMSGEDLIVVSTGSSRPVMIGQVEANSQELNPREMVLKVKADDPKIVDIFDRKSGDLLGSRTVSSENNFLFRNFDWTINGQLETADEFQVLTSNEKKDDGSNLARLMELSSLSERTGKGGYSEQYNDLVTSTGFHLRAGEQNLVNANTIYEVALDRKSAFSGVDLDTEAANLLEQQQAYQALARVLSTAKELLDTLLRSL